VTTAGKVLIVEDQERVARAIALLLGLDGVPSTTVGDPEAALALLEGEEVDLVIQDMNFAPGESGGQEGIALFRSLRERAPDMPVLLVTAWPSLETAVSLVKEGAADYLEKPWDDDRLLATVRNLLRMRELERENQRLRAEGRRTREQLAARFDLRGLVYASAAMHEVVSLAVRVAPSGVPVLITGPNGTGKELLAEVIHANSRRRERPMVRVNVGALPDTLLEAELFGAEAGAYTGAEARRVGRFEAANGGTLLLDEIGNLSIDGQAKLLRVLQIGEFQRLGSSRTQRADVRVVAATNSDLREAIAAGRFREDLYFRLNVLEVSLPALAGRIDDIDALADHFVAELGGRGGEHTLSGEARGALRRHDWPGNVRELRNRVQRALVVAEGDEITPADLGLERVAPAGSRTGRASPGSGAGPTPEPGDARERQRIEEALTSCSGIVARAAETLGLSRQALYRRMERLGITVKRQVGD
jgi:DNA-binding NtrC family response regulator